jgi:hypothetical protein
MDFRRPGEHPTEDMQRHYDGTNGTMPPVQPFQRAIVPPESHKGLKLLVWLLTILVVGAAGYGTYAFMTQHDLQTQLDSANAQVRSLTVDKALLEAKATKTDPKTTTSNLTAEEKINVVAGTYACNIDQFGCDKVSKTITKLQKYVAPGPGIAVVKITNTPTGATTNLYLRTVDDTSWVVVYEGASAPSNDVAKRYAIPSDFTRLP